ncbi:MAG: PEGA domain-containing protein [Verrucomicrobia bacterium]|nr:PEGA domain-containing protein [Verrucomicrobiota bacterium]
MNHPTSIARFWPVAALAAVLLAAAGCFEQSGNVLDVRTSPAGARIEVDGEYKGESPLKLKSVAGKQHLIVATRDGFLETRTGVTVQPTDTTRLDLSLRPLFGLALVESFPTDSEVLVDGMSRGKTPVLLTDVPAGQHRILIKRDGYESKETPLNIQTEADRQPKLVSLELRSLLAAIKVTCTPDGDFVEDSKNGGKKFQKAQVFIDGSCKGDVPQSIQDILVGRHKVRVELEGYEPYEQEVEVAGHQEYHVSATLKEKYARIRIETNPKGAEVFLNSENNTRGMAPVVLDGLRDGEYTIKVVKANYPEAVRKVTLKKGDDLSLNIPLERRTGILQVITIPPGVDVFVDGEKRGVTVGLPNVHYSTPLLISDVLEGTRIVKLIKPGFGEIQRVVTITKDKAETISNVQLRRLFIPDTAIATKDGRNLRGLINRVDNDGTVHFETAPGIFVDVPPDDIVSKKPLVSAGR